MDCLEEEVSFWVVIFKYWNLTRSNGSTHLLLLDITSMSVLKTSHYTMDAIFSPETLLDFFMHYMRDYRVSPHRHRFLLFCLAKIGENGG